MRWLILLSLLTACVTTRNQEPKTPCEEARQQALVESFTKAPVTTYSAQWGGTGAREPSPYLKQLKMECAAYLRNQQQRQE
jgi:hypothetical protein